MFPGVVLRLALAKTHSVRKPPSLLFKIPFCYDLWVVVIFVDLVVVVDGLFLADSYSCCYYSCPCILLVLVISLSLLLFCSIGFVMSFSCCCCGVVCVSLRHASFSVVLHSPL